MMFQSLIGIFTIHIPSTDHDYVLGTIERQRETEKMNNLIKVSPIYNKNKSIDKQISKLRFTKERTMIERLRIPVDWMITQ